MYSNLRRMIDNKLSQFSLYTMLRSYLPVSYTKLQNALMLMGWVLLGLGLVRADFLWTTTRSGCAGEASQYDLKTT